MIRGEKIKSVLNSTEPRDSVCINGWVRQKRVAKGLIFLEINDGSVIRNIQAVIDEKLENFEQIKKMFIGSCVRVTGALTASPGTEQSYEIQAHAVEILGACDSDYPLQKKRHGFEFLRTIAHLRPRTNAFGAVFRVRNAASFAVHEFFQEKGFYYIHTPIISASDCEGAGEMFHVSTVPLNAVPTKKTPDGAMVDYTQDFFKQETGLTVSGQLEAELFALALSDVYTFGPTFRAENSNTPRHVAEFWMIEPEMAFYDLDDDIVLAEEFVKQVTARVLDRCSEDMAFFGKWVDKSLQDRLDVVIRSPFEVISYDSAIEILKSSKVKFEYPVQWGIDLQTEHERHLTEDVFKKPVFVRDYPREIKPFYMRVNSGEKTVAAVDLLIPGIGEVIGGSQREERLDVLKEQFRRLNLDEAAYWWYLDVRRFGSAPHSGFGLGFGRFVQYLTGMSNIRDVIPFPRTPGNAEF